MNHEETIALLDDYLYGETSAESRKGIEAHLAGCEDCMELTRVYRALKAAAAEIEESSGSELSSRGATWKWMPIAAGLLVALLAYPAYLGLVRLPDVAGELDATEESLRTLQAESGSVGPNMIKPQVRGTDEPSAVVIEPGAPWVLLGFELLVPESLSDRTPMRIEILAEEGNVAWSATIPAADLREAVRRAGFATVVVPAGVLQPGPYRLSVVDDTGTSVALLLHFRVWGGE
jgi:hypothetical protein